jgi:hypothetical protein
MKLYNATLETVPNNCYVETVIIIADNEEEAHQLLVKKNGQWGVKYTQKMEELKIDMSKKQVIEVGFGHGERDYGWDD